MGWSLWFFRTRAKPTCQICHSDQAKGLKASCPGIDWVTKCPLNHVPKLSHGNADFIGLFIKMCAGLYDGMGGVKYSAITTVFDIYGIGQEDRPGLFEKCLVCIKAIERIQEQERDAKHKAKSNGKR